MGMIGAELKPVVGYLLYATGWLGVYMVGAIVNNHIFGRVVLPTFGSFVK